MKTFEEKFGFRRDAVSLANWRERPYSTWSFQHVSEIVPSAVVGAGGKGAVEPGVSTNTLDDLMVVIGDESLSVSAFLERSETDLFLVSRKGRVIMDWRADHASAAAPHIVFSISKSITAILAGILQDQGLLEPERQVADYLPQAAGSGFGDCSIQNVLDMRVSLEFTEEYLNKDGDYARYRRATAWNPPEDGRADEGLADFLYSMPKGAGEHGGPFRYLSPNADLLSLLLEHITGQPYCELMSALLWQPMGAAADACITVDRRGAPRGAGGISMAAIDLLRLGEMLRRDGSFNGKQVVSQRWLDDMLHAGDGDAWAQGGFAAFLPGARYRNQWYQLGGLSRAFLAIGIHGQWLYVDPATETVIVRMSSQAIPQNDSLDVQCVSFFDQIARM